VIADLGGDRIKQVISQNRSKIQKFSNITGFGPGLKISQNKVTNERCVIVTVKRKIDDDKISKFKMRSVPKEIDGIKTDVIQATPYFLSSNTDHIRPARPGSSIGHYDITAGTFGLLVKDNKTGKKMILSNNHVLANMNKAWVGDPILQPGPIDGGNLIDDSIAKLSKFIPFRFTRFVLGSDREFNLLIEGTNIVDCAVAEVLRDDSVSSDIIDIGQPNGIAKPEEGMMVQKSGRTTGHTRGQILSVDYESSVGMHEGGGAYFTHQTLISSPTGFSAGGDSGSCILNDQNKAVNLLFAGSDEDNITIANNLETVMNFLDVKL